MQLGRGSLVSLLPALLQIVLIVSHSYVVTRATKHKVETTSVPEGNHRR